MLAALIAMYNSTYSILGTAVITSVIGVRQGCPTSCLLFIIFLNELVKMYKSRCGFDGFLGWVHYLLLMDDTVILSTDRQKCVDKLGIMMEFCKDYGMVRNSKKSMFMVINGSTVDKQPVQVDHTIIGHNPYNNYLGAIFTEDGKFKSMLTKHVSEKQTGVFC